MDQSNPKTSQFVDSLRYLNRAQMFLARFKENNKNGIKIYGISNDEFDQEVVDELSENI